MTTIALVIIVMVLIVRLHMQGCRLDDLEAIVERWERAELIVPSNVVRPAKWGRS